MVRYVVVAAIICEMNGTELVLIAIEITFKFKVGTHIEK